MISVASKESPRFAERKVWGLFKELVPGIHPKKSIIALREAYNQVCSKVNCRREKFCARTENVENVQSLLGHKYGHLSTDMLSYLIITAAKNPYNHGGGWANTGSNNHGAGKGYKDRLDLENSPDSSDYAKRLKEHDWLALRNRRFVLDGNRCKLCNRSGCLEPHHRRYDRMRTKYEIRDLVTLCRDCHELWHWYGRDGRRKKARMPNQQVAI